MKGAAMKKTILLAVLFVLLTASSAFADCKVEGAAAPLKVVGAEATSVATPTLAAALDKIGRKYQEMMLPDRTGKMVRRSCNFQCTNGCSQARFECSAEGHDASYCQAQWMLCMCEGNCCTGPTGNPYCE
jgi:hypothetical protein